MSTQSAKNSILESNFFNVPAKLSKQQVIKYCELWWPIYIEFGLGSVVMTGNIATLLLKAIQNKDEAEEKFLSKILAWQANASMTELDTKGIHSSLSYLWFKKKVSEGGINFSAIESFDASKAPAPLIDLRKLVSSALREEKNVPAGLCMMYVSETFLYKFYEIQSQIFKAASIGGSAYLNTEMHSKRNSIFYELDYLYRHLILYYDREKVEDAIDLHCTTWKNYLDMLVREVYSE